MHIKQLVSFVTVARTKNMAQTALALNYSHSTIFGHLESLEKSIVQSSIAEHHTELS